VAAEIQRLGVPARFVAPNLLEPYRFAGDGT
jgi:hypothetical protein